MDVDTDPCYCMVTDPDMALDGSMGQDFFRDSGGSGGYSQRAVPHHPRVSGSASLHSTESFLILVLYLLSITYLHIIVVLTVEVAVR